MLGWKAIVSVPDFDKSVICAAPHTSNADLFIGKIFYWAIGRETSFMMKKEWFFFPLGIVSRALGGIPVNRKQNTSMVDQMVEVFATREKFNITITPEGTRKANANWKRGFYYIALNAHVPIVLIGLDYKTKTINAGKVLYPTGDIEKDMEEIKAYFSKFQGKYPERFST